MIFQHYLKKKANRFRRGLVFATGCQRSSTDFNGGGVITHQPHLIF